MKQFSKPTTLVLGLIVVAILTAFLLLISENIILRIEDLSSFLSAILFFSWVLATNEFTKSTWYQNPLFLILLIVISFFIPLSNEHRWLFLFLLSTCGILLNHKKLNTRKFLTTILQTSGFFFLLKLLFNIFSKIPDYILQFFSFGYDNAFHFAIYRYYRAEPWFPFGTQTPWGTDFELFKTYPSGQGALWSFLAEPIIGDSLDSEKNLVVYAVINLAVLIVATWLVFKCVQQYSQKKEDFLFIGIASLVISIGYFGIFLTNGFIPYAAGILILLIYLVGSNLDQDKTSKYLNAFFATLLLLLISPALVAFLLLPGLITTIKYFREANSSSSYMRIVFILIISSILASIGYFFQVVTSSNFGWRQILSPGGAIKPNIFVALFLLLSIVFTVATKRKWILNNIPIQLVLSGAFSVGLLSTITIIFTGSVQYYAVKQLHVWLVLAALCVATLLTSLKRVAVGVNSLKIVFIILLIAPLVTSTALRSGWMGNMFGVISLSVDKSRWDSQIVKVGKIRSGLETVNSEKNSSVECLILRAKDSESDLNSRWINALNVEPSITSRCFAAFWNSTPLTRDELELRLKELEGNFLILTDVNEELTPIKVPNFRYIFIPAAK